MQNLRARQSTCNCCSSQPDSLCMYRNNQQSSGVRHLDMAEGASTDATDSTLLQSGEVNYRGVSHQLFLVQKGLELVPLQQESKAGEVDGNVPVIDVPWRDVICACEATVKKSKAQSKSKPTSDGSTQAKNFVVHYLVKNKKTFKVQCKNVVLETSDGTAEGWITQIEKKRKEGKPHKLLIIINPIGGKGTAWQVFKKQVQPMFALAGVELVVKVTERSQHAIEITKTFDVSSVDGVIVMGGDGLYMEILHGLTLRKQEEEGVDFNDPDTQLVSPTVRVGIIPAGTGNALSDTLNGVTDINTAVWNIIRGEIEKMNICSIHAQQKLIVYAGVIITNGFFSEMVKRTDELRWMRRARYAYALISTLFRKRKIFDFDIEVLKNGQCQSNREDETKPVGDETVATAAAETPEWTKLGTKQLTAFMTFTSKIQVDSDVLVMNPKYPSFDLVILKDPSIIETTKFFFAFITKKREAMDRASVEWIPDIRGMRFKFVPKEETAASSSQQTELLEICKLLDVDGEIVKLAEPNFEIRLHPQFLSVFCCLDYMDVGKTASC